jgi:hypothetical protein
MLGSDRSRAYCLEMICADFLAGANHWGSGNTVVLNDEVLQVSPRRTTAIVSCGRGREGIVNLVPSDPPRLRMDPEAYDVLRLQVLRRDGWRCQSCGTMSNLEVHHIQFRSHSGDDSEENLITLCSACHALIHG